MTHAIRNLILAILAFGAVLSTPAPAYANGLVIPTSRSLFINGVITGRSLTPLKEALVKYANESSRPINIIINSPGGEVISGMMFINAMHNAQARGIQFQCYVTDVAASMAFQILTQCDSRYALETSFVLYHRVRVGFMGILTAPMAEAVADDLQRFDALIMNQLLAVLSGMDGGLLSSTFEAERLWFGAELQAASGDSFFRGITTGYRNLTEASKSAVTSGGGFEDRIESRENVPQYIYIWSAVTSLAD